MRTVSELEVLQKGRPTILTIGAFDGVHRGHQWLIDQVITRAKTLESASMVITFDPAPQVALRPGSTQLTDGAEKTQIISSLGPDTLAVVPFTKQFSQVAASEFLGSLLEHVNLSEIWIGADFAFGHNREGNVEMLIQNCQRGCYAVHVVPRQGTDRVPISSTGIRELVKAGKVSEATIFLGHYFSVRGRVVPGKGRGKDLGFPTANLDVPPYQLLPALGVYAGYARVGDKQYRAAVSVGYNVVFGGQTVKVETYLLDFDSDIRDKVMSIDFVQRVSDEENFETVDDLVAKMQRDVEKVRAIVGK